MFYIYIFGIFGTCTKILSPLYCKTIAFSLFCKHFTCTWALKNYASFLYFPARHNLCAAAMTVAVACSVGCPSGTVFSLNWTINCIHLADSQLLRHTSPSFVVQRSGPLSVELFTSQMTVWRLLQMLLCFSFIHSAFSSFSSLFHYTARTFAKMVFKAVDGRKKVAYERRLHGQTPAP